MSKLWGIALAACAGLLATGSLARATVLAPGTDASPITTTALGGGTLVATTGVRTYAFATIDGSGVHATGGDYVQNVVRDRVGNIFGPGTLSFEYQFDVVAPGSFTAVQALTAGNFAFFATDVSYVPTTTTVPVFAASRSSDGVGITALYSGGGVSPGATSAVLIIDTNAVATVNGSIGLEGGGGATGTLGVFGPAPAPEPATLTLALVGLPVLGAFGYRRLRRARPTPT
jgi:hypothetical protein